MAKSLEGSLCTKWQEGETDNPTTWGTNDEPELCPAKILNGQDGGIGIQLDDLGNGSAGPPLQLRQFGVSSALRVGD
jgi:hypothetical protein